MLTDTSRKGAVRNCYKIQKTNTGLPLNFAASIKRI